MMWIVTIVLYVLSCCTYAQHHEEIFSNIYHHGIWGTNAQGEGHSGGGSTVEHTQQYVQFLQRFMKEKNVTSVVDAGCGDWEFSRFINWSGITYRGYDIVLSVIEKNRRQFSQENIQFFHTNILNTEFPHADLLICKHVLQHLPNADIVTFIRRHCSRFKYCIITNEVDPKTLSSNNSDITVGKTHSIDLNKPPFSLVGYKALTYYIHHVPHQVFVIDNSGNSLRK